jgi:peptidoglycan/LPS O-acetylase OafA/YrhL
LIEKQRMVLLDRKLCMNSFGGGGRIPALDGVRGIAILLVLVFHFTMYGPHSLTLASADRVFHRLSQAGWIGVDLFFVLSGFLITGILYDARRKDHYFRDFYARRILRIFPLYYGSLILFTFVLPYLFSGHPALESPREDAVWYWTYLANLRIAAEGWPELGTIAHFWSLAIEEQFYLVWPVVVLVFGRRELMRVCVACFFFALAFRVGFLWGGYEEASFVLTPARMDSLAAGGLLALLVREPGGLERVARYARPVTAGLGICLGLLFLSRRGLSSEDPMVATWGLTLFAFFFAGVVGVALTSPSNSYAGRVFESSTLRFFGRYSYGLYVFHHPLLFLKPDRFLLESWPQIYGSWLPVHFLFMLAATAASLALAVPSWHLYEKHFLKRKYVFSSGPKTAPTSSTPISPTVP